MRVGVWFDRKEKPKVSNPYQFLEISQDGQKDRTRYYLANPKLELTDDPLAIQWKENLNRLVDAIAQGQMPVSPKSRLESCRYCDYADFCRINEHQPDDGLAVLEHKESNI